MILVEYVKTFVVFTRWISRFMYILAGIMLTLSMLLTVSDVILRAFKRPITGTYELVGLLGAFVIAFSLPQTSRLNGHVIMDFVTGSLSKGTNRILIIVTRIMGIVLFSIIAWNLLQLGHDYKQSGEVTLTLQLPLYPAAYAIALSCAIECLVLFASIFVSEENPS
jgi:TRAP-type C4-dicarboxylate transport system permease small subunit